MSTTHAQLDRELDALRPLWEQAALDADTCRCSAWHEHECACGKFVDTTAYVQRREIAYLRNRIVKAAS